MKAESPVYNCYRALLAQVNYLDSVWARNSSVKDIYQDLSELAFYLMENDKVRVYKGIEQMKLTVNEIERGPWMGDHEDDVAVRLIITEIKTHLQYLRIEYGRGA